MKKLFVLSLLITSVQQVWCQDSFIYDGMEYEILTIDHDTDSGTARLTDGGRPHYSSIDGIYYISDQRIEGSVDIPETVRDTLFEYYYDEYGYILFKEVIGIRYFTVTEIGGGAFSLKSDIVSVSLPPTIESVGGGCFNGCDNLTSVSLNEGLRSIGFDAFRFSGIKSLFIPSTVDSISGELCEHCPNLESIVVSQANGKYDSRDNCNAIIETASNRLFVACNKTRIPEGIETIETNFDCQGLTSLHIPASVINIKNIVTHCHSLSSITVDKNNPVYDSRNDCNAIIVTASDSLIVGCKNTIIPEDVVAIGNAFWDCPGLTSINIPSNVRSIGLPDPETPPYYIFSDYNCGAISGVNLRKVVMNRDIPPVVSHGAFSVVYPEVDGTVYDGNTYILGALYVPRGSVQQYRAVENWNRFRNIVEKDMTPISENRTIDYHEYYISADDYRYNFLDYYENTYYSPVHIVYNVLHYNVSFQNDKQCMNIKTIVKDVDLKSIVGVSLENDSWTSDYNGMVFKLRGGSGTITIDAETQGNRSLNVKIGDQEPIIKELDAKQKVSIPYQAEAESYVYIYSDELSHSEAKKSPAADNEEGMLSIFSIGWEFDDEGSENLQEIKPVQTIESQRYLLDGRMATEGSRGLNIVRMNDGTYRKVFVK